MKFTKYGKRGKIDKYVSERTVITFMTGRNKIFVIKRQHGGKREYIQSLLNRGFTRKSKAGA